MTLDDIHNMAALAGVQASPAMFSSTSEVASLAQAVASLSTALVGIAEHLKSNPS